MCQIKTKFWRVKSTTDQVQTAQFFFSGVNSVKMESSQTNLTDLNDDCLVEIFRKLNKLSRIEISFTCKRFQDLIEKEGLLRGINTFTLANSVRFNGHVFNDVIGDQLMKRNLSQSFRVISRVGHQLEVVRFKVIAENFDNFHVGERLRSRHLLREIRTLFEFFATKASNGNIRQLIIVADKLHEIWFILLRPILPRLHRLRLESMNLWPETIDLMYLSPYLTQLKRLCIVNCLLKPRVIEPPNDSYRIPSVESIKFGITSNVVERRSMDDLERLNELLSRSPQEFAQLIVIPDFER